MYIDVQSLRRDLCNTVIHVCKLDYYQRYTGPLLLLNIKVYFHLGGIGKDTAGVSHHSSSCLVSRFFL